MEGKERMTANGYQVRFEDEKSVLELCCCDRCTTLTILKITREFLGSPVVRTWHFPCLGSIPGQGTKIPQAMSQCQKTNKQKKSLNCALKWLNNMVYKLYLN